MIAVIEDKKIKLSSKKLMLMLVLSALFVLAGIAMVFAGSSSDIAIGLMAIVFFGLVGVIIVKKLTTRQAGLVLSHAGITDHSTGVSLGFIPWTDVVGIAEVKVKNQKSAAILVKNPEDYLKKGNFFVRLTNKLNLKLYGSVINITANTLQISHQELMQLLNDYKEKATH